MTFPIFESGQVVGMRGRAIEDKGWMNASGTRAGFFNLGGVTPGCVLYVVENMIDAVWVMDIHPEYTAIAPITGAATRMRPEWADQIAAQQPSVVVPMSRILEPSASAPPLKYNSSTRAKPVVST